MTDVAAQERAALCDLFEDLGPDAPTLCGGWRNRELAGHLVVRERNPLAGPGILLKGPPKQLTGWLERQAAQRPFDTLVRTLRSGAPPWLPFGLPVLSELTQQHEYFVHHEDVLRANGRTRTPSPELEAALWARLGNAAWFLLRRAPVGVTLVHPDGRTLVAKKGQPVVRVLGRPGELVLWAFGRDEHADVELDGEPAAVERLRRTSFGI